MSFFNFQSISPGLVETDMVNRIEIFNTKEMATLKPIDIADAILYVLGAPQRVNVSELQFFFNI